MEPLEDRWLLSGNVISGYVYNDANNNGIFDPGESPIANSGVQLVNAAGVVIAKTIADASGFYQFATDNTISTTPTTLSRTITVAGSPTDWTKPLSLAQFDPSLGTLTSVDITNAGAATHKTVSTVSRLAFLNRTI